MNISIKKNAMPTLIGSHASAFAIMYARPASITASSRVSSGRGTNRAYSKAMIRVSRYAARGRIQSRGMAAMVSVRELVNALNCMAATRGSSSHRHLLLIDEIGDESGDDGESDGGAASTC